MVENTIERGQFKWRLPLYIAVGGLILGLSIELSSFFDLGEIFYLFMVAPIIAFYLAVDAFHKRSLPVFLIFLMYCAASWGLLRGTNDIRDTGRWLLWSRSYKLEVLNQPEPSAGQLKHIEWDGWGFPGADDTYVYLVFDPANSLSTAAKRHSPGNFKGIPCTVQKVRRLGSQWYSVLFYTDTSWDNCS